MAVDKLVDSTQLDADLTSVANAIRTKGGTSAQMAFPAGFVSAVRNIPTSGSDYPADIPKVGDGNAYIHVYLFDDDLTVNPYVSFASGRVLIDWGDGDVEESTSGGMITHTYDHGGYYIIKMSILSGTAAFGSSPNYWLFGGGSELGRVSQAKIIGFESGLFDIKSLEFLTRSNATCIYMGQSPRGGSAPLAQHCQTLRHLEFPSAITSIPTNAFTYCFRLKSIIIPANVTSIATSAFSHTAGLSVHLLPTTPPTLSSTSAFPGVDETTIYVPYSADHSILEAYKTATNWSTYESKIFEEEP